MNEFVQFLNDRLNEDLYAARLPTKGWVDLAEELPLGCWDNQRVLAEIEAKREIVAAAAQDLTARPDRRIGRWRRWRAHRTLVSLASVYPNPPVDTHHDENWSS